MSIAATVLAEAVAVTTSPAFSLLNLFTAAKPNLSIPCALAVAGASLMVWQHHKVEGLRAENVQLQLRLSQAQVQRQETHAMPEEESPWKAADYRELLRLRGEITLLRRQAMQAISNVDASEAIRKSIVGKPLPRESLVDLGTASPEATTETFFWGLADHDHASTYNAGGWPPGLGSIARGGDLENASNFITRVGPLLLGDPERIVSVELESATVSPYDTRLVPVILVRDDGTSSSGEVTLTRGLGGWAVMLYGRGQGANVELSFSDFPK